MKWAGGKRQILTEFERFYPRKFERYHEPFVGGGAVFFDMVARGMDMRGRAVLSDSNGELINCYKAIQKDVEKLIESLERHIYEKDYYYSMRDVDPAELEPVERASRTIYLNKTGFNGLYRVNSKGKFNVPFGRHKNPKICDADNLRACSLALREIDLKCMPFPRVLETVSSGDFVYFDPPYIPVSPTAYFTAYQEKGFGAEHQERLAEVFDELARKGVHVMLSNSDVPWIRERYRKYKMHFIKARRGINRDSLGRGPVAEVVVTSYKP